MLMMSDSMGYCDDDERLHNGNFNDDQKIKSFRGIDRKKKKAPAPMNRREEGINTPLLTPAQLRPKSTVHHDLEKARHGTH